MKGRDNMLDWSLLQSILIIAIACSSITVVFIQKTKKFCKSSRCIISYGLLVNMVLGFLFSQTFSDINYIKSLWVGLFSFLGADTIYKNLEGKIASYTELNKDKILSSTNTTASNGNVTNSKDILGEITYE